MLKNIVVAAVSSAIEKAPDEIIIRKLLEHSEQRFRLSYLLGVTTPLDSEVSGELLDEVESHHPESGQGEGAVQEVIDINEAEHKDFETHLTAFLQHVKLKTFIARVGRIEVRHVFLGQYQWNCFLRARMVVVEIAGYVLWIYPPDNAVD